MRDPSASPVRVLLPEPADWRTFGTGGGIQTFVNLMVHHASRVGIQLTVLCSGSEEHTRDGTRLRPIMRSAGSEFAYTRQLRRMARRGAFRDVGSPVILADAEHYAWAFRGTGFPIALLAHGVVSETLRLRHRASYVRLYKEFIEAPAVHDSRRILSISQAVHIYYVTNYPDCRRKVTAIPFGIDLQEIPSPSRGSVDSFGLDPSKPILLFVGRLYPEKNLALFIQACEVLKSEGMDFQAVAVGDGIQNGLARIAMSKHTWFRWIPRLEHSRLLTLMVESSVLVICSSYEGLPVVLLEAVGCEVPVVSTAVGRASELVTPDNGRIVEPDARSVAAGIRESLALNRHDVRRASHALYPLIDFTETAGALARVLGEIRRE